MRIGACPGIGPGGVAEGACPPHPFSVVHVGGMHSPLLLLSVLQKWQLYFSHDLSAMCKQSPFSLFILLLYFVPQEMFVQVHSLQPLQPPQPRVPGPNLSQ